MGNYFFLQESLQTQKSDDSDEVNFGSSDRASLLVGKKYFISDHVNPGHHVLKKIIEECGGEIVEKMSDVTEDNSDERNKYIVITDQADDCAVEDVNVISSDEILKIVM